MLITDWLHLSEIAKIIASTAHPHEAPASTASSNNNAWVKRNSTIATNDKLKVLSSD